MWPKRLKHTTDEKRRILTEELRVSSLTLGDVADEQLEELFPDDYFDDPIEFESKLTIEDKKTRLTGVGKEFLIRQANGDRQLNDYYEYILLYKTPESTIRRRTPRKQARKELAQRLASGTNKYTTTQKRQMLMDRYLILEAKRWPDETIELLFPDHALDDLNGFEKSLSLQEKEERLRLVNGDADVDSSLRYAERTGKTVEEAINFDYQYAFNTDRSVGPVLYLPKGFEVYVYKGSGPDLIGFYVPGEGVHAPEHYDHLKQKFIREWKAKYPQDHPSTTTSIDEVD